MEYLILLTDHCPKFGGQTTVNHFGTKESAIEFAKQEIDGAKEYGITVTARILPVKGPQA